MCILAKLKQAEHQLSQQKLRTQSKYIAHIRILTQGDRIQKISYYLIPKSPISLVCCEEIVHEIRIILNKNHYQVN